MNKSRSFTSVEKQNRFDLGDGSSTSITGSFPLLPPFTAKLLNGDICTFKQSRKDAHATGQTQNTKNLISFKFVQNIGKNNLETEENKLKTE